MQADQRIFILQDYLQPSADDPIRSLVLQTEHAAIVAWHVAPGQEIAAHIHPGGQDTWTVVSGEADYYLGGRQSVKLKPGDIAVAKVGEVHGALNTGSEPFVFVSVVAGMMPGYQLANK